MDEQDIFAQAEGLKRRQALLQAMQQQSMQAPIQGKGYGLAQALAKLGTAAILANRQEGMQAEDSALRGQYNTQLAGELNKYLDTRQGVPGQTLTTEQAGNILQNDQPAPPLAEPIAADPRKAIVNAMSSRFPELQSVGKADMASLLQKPKAEYKDEVVDGKVVRVFADGRAQSLGDFKERDEWSEPYDMTVDGKTLRVIKNRKSGDIKAIGAGQTINVNNAADDKGQAAVLTTMAEQVSPKGKSYESALAATQQLRLTTEALGAMKAGADMGALADYGQVLRKVGERLGLESAATAPTDQLSSVLKQRIFAKLGGLGVAISDADRKFMQEAGGDLAKDPRAMRRLLALDAAASIKEASAHNARVDQMASRGGAYDLLRANRLPVSFQSDDPEFTAMLDNALAGKPTIAGLPAAPAAAKAPPTENVISYDQWLKSQKGGR